jgi:hypothetical protein
LAVLSPDGLGRLLQLQTTTGLTVTTSLERTRPRFVGDSKDVNRWLLGVQPAWSLDLLWLWQGTAWARRSFAPREVPLSRVPPIRVHQEPAFGSARFPLNVNRNLQAAPLRSLTREAGWGFSVHALSELEFELPPSARTFRSEFALDAAMQTGGCVQARILDASAPNNPLYQGPVVTGSESVLDTGPLAIGGSGETTRRFVLQVDPVLVNRPANADPFHIRDQAAWLDPTVELDSAGLKQQLDRRRSDPILAWKDWELLLEAEAQVQRTNYFAETSGTAGEYLSAISTTGGSFLLARKQSLLGNERWLVVDAVRTLPPDSPCKLAVTVGGSPPVEWELPLYDRARADFRPLVLSLAEARRQGQNSVTIQIRQLSSPERVKVLWRALAVADQHPLLYRWLEDAPEDPATLPTGGVFDDRQPFTGKSSYRLAGGVEVRLPLGRLIPIRERPQLGEYRFLRFAVRKQGGGGLRVALQHAGSADRPAQYVAGGENGQDRSVRRLSPQPVAEGWQTFTRDLFADFGNLDVSGLIIEIAEGERAWLDHVYLARSQSDFDLIPGTIP